MEEKGLADGIVSIASRLRNAAAGFPDAETELVLNVTASDDGRRICHYYFVDPTNRRLVAFRCEIGKLVWNTIQTTKPDKCVH
ncbi:hypothetical protein JVT61DRAFT_13945 [Boletus reticuloceps]|uniref:Uncharacterized protein n=1 Tax=Boletus reticuloceps TaxID=495285 RepID=A0A8I2YU76_9AGAM|nr:hypothetical protein JVT61DRAFT_13945 [Boletus reticuloceps]